MQDSQREALAFPIHPRISFRKWMMKDNFTFLRPRPHLVDFFLNFLQCSFNLKFNHIVATGRVNV
jgi:hypothetical protein